MSPLEIQNSSDSIPPSTLSPLHSLQHTRLTHTSSSPPTSLPFSRIHHTHTYIHT
jgi:hypothetical protein